MPTWKVHRLPDLLHVKVKDVWPPQPEVLMTQPPTPAPETHWSGSASTMMVSAAVVVVAGAAAAVVAAGAVVVAAGVVVVAAGVGAGVGAAVGEVVGEAVGEAVAESPLAAAHWASVLTRVPTWAM
mmetsp:Transcript_59069/g.189981  ORF Transcript_59069/g.189981 Transcript_59069/m.189981 type:complete len:126 (+) Transcript_59069:390-767(+)